jgi:transposase
VQAGGFRRHITRALDGSTGLENFVLDYLPHYSPQLNPIERVWKLTRRLRLHNLYFPVLTKVVAAIETQLENWRNGNETLAVYAQSRKTLWLI